VIMTNPGTYTGNTVIKSATLQVGNLVSGAATAIYNFALAGTNSTTIPNLGSGGSVMNGKLVNGAMIVSGSGIGGANALYLSGTGAAGTALSSAYMAVNNGIEDLSGGGNWTVYAVIKTSTTGASILAKGNGGWANEHSQFFLHNGNGDNAPNAGGGSYMGAVRYAGGWVSGNTPVADNNWHYVAITDAGGTKAVYTDGISNTLLENQFTTPDSGGTVAIGDGQHNDGSVAFAGLMEDVYLFPYALTQTELQTLQSGGTVSRTVAAGTGSLQTTTPVQIGPAGALDLAGNNQKIGSLSDLTPGAGGSVTNSGVHVGATLTVSPTAGVSTTFSGAISDGLGKLGFALNGSGTQVLTGTNTYTGGTTVASGTLIVTTPLGIEDGTNLTVGNPTVFGDPPLPSEAIPAAPVAAAAAASSTLAPVPEPGTLALAAAGVVAALAMARRRKASRQRAG